MKKSLLRLPACAIAVVLALTACNESDVSGSNADKPSGSSSHHSTRSDADPAGNQTIDGSVTEGIRTPNPSQPGNPCAARVKTALEAVYGGPWTSPSPENPPQNGAFRKRVCIYNGKVTGYYNGQPGTTVPVKLAVVTYIDDTKGTLFKRLVQWARTNGTYVEAISDADNTAGAGAFYDGEPGKAPLTAQDNLNTIIYQIVPMVDESHALVDDPNHLATSRVGQPCIG